MNRTRLTAPPRRPYIFPMVTSRQLESRADPAFMPPLGRPRTTFLSPLCLLLLALSTGCSRVQPASRTPGSIQPPARVRLVPDTARYRVASYLRVEQQLDNQPQVSNLSLVYLLRVTLAPGSAPGELHAEITVDSTRYEGFGTFSQPASRALGLRFTATLLPTGELKDLQGGGSTDPLLAEIARDVREFFPRLPSSGLARGDSWTDTTQQEIVFGGVPLTIHSVAEHVVGEPVEHGGGRVFPITTLTRYSFSGTGRQGGQEFTVEGSGRRHTTESVSLEGRYRGLVAADTSDFTITLTVAGFRIVGKQFRVDTVQAVR